VLWEMALLLLVLAKVLCVDSLTDFQGEYSLYFCMDVRTTETQIKDFAMVRGASVFPDERVLSLYDRKLFNRVG
jgi:hypothetical protein